MAEIDRPDLISDEAFKAPKELAESLGAVEEVLDQIIAKGGAHSTIIQSAKSTKDLAKASVELEKEQTKLQDAQKKVADAQKKVNKEMNSGAQSMEVLDNHTGGLINRSKELGKQFMALAKNPWVLLIATLVGVIAAAGGAMKKFLTTTGEGEDILNRQIAVWDQFWATIGKGIKTVGKDIVKSFGEDGLEKFLLAILTYYLPALAAEFARTSIEAKKLADAIDDIEERRARNIVKRAETELKYNKLVLESEKLKREDAKAARALLIEANTLKENQMKIDKQIAEDHAKAVLYGIGLEHGLEKAQVDRMSISEMEAEFTGDQMVKIMQARADAINLEAAYNQEVKRNTAKIINFDLEIHKEKLDNAKKEVEAKVAAQKEIAEKEIMEIQKAVLDGNKLKEDGDKEILKVKKKYADDIVDTEIKALENLLKETELNADERAEVEKKLAELRVQYHQAMYDQIEQIQEASVEGDSLETTLGKIKDAYENLVSGIGDLFNTLTENRMANIDREENRLKELYDKDIEMAGDNEKRKAELSNELARKQEKLEHQRIQAQRRAAIFDKFTSAAQAGIASALAVISMLKAGPGGIPLSIAAGITGAASVAAILAKEIPQYEEGGETTAETIIAGERGHELYRTPSGKYGMTPNRATIMRLPIGTKIYNNEETMAKLALSRMMAPELLPSVGIDEGMSKFFGSLERTIKNKKEVHLNVTKRGMELLILDAHQTTKLLNDLYS